MVSAVHVAVGAGLAGLGVAGFIFLRSREEDGSGGGAGAPADNVGREAYSLARVIASEAGGEPAAVRVAVAWGTINEARTRARHGTSIRGWVFDGTVTNLVQFPDGMYGPQNRGAYCSTARAPSQADSDLALDILEGRIADPTGGAQQYDSPNVQRALAAKGVKGYVHPDGTPVTPEEVAERRRRDGNALVLIAGVDPDRFRMWRRA
jgi:hypothetical protein